MMRERRKSHFSQRPLAGLLCRLHYPALWAVRGAFRLCQGRSEKAGAGLRGHRLRLPFAGHLSRRHPHSRQAASGAAGTDRRHPHEYRDGRRCALAGARQRRSGAHSQGAGAKALQPGGHPHRLDENGARRTGHQPARGWLLRLRLGHPQAANPAHAAPDRRLAGQTPYDLRIEGHTDNIPIHTAEFDSNWELSSARATRIARLLLDFKTISPDRISAAGYAEFHPIASNDTPRAAPKTAASISSSCPAPASISPPPRRPALTAAGARSPTTTRPIQSPPPANSPSPRPPHSSHAADHCSSQTRCPRRRRRVDWPCVSKRAKR